MKGFRPVLILLLVLAFSLSACGRRLPDETAVAASSNTTTEEETVAETATEEAVTEDAEAEATEEVVADAEEASAEEEAASVEETTAEEPAVDTSDPFAVRVAESDAANGETLFNTMNQTGFACSTCHHVDQEAMLVGPGLLGIPSRAATRVEGETAPEYLYHSITATNDYVVEGYPQSVMPQTYPDVYSEDEIYDIIAYLMTLGDPAAQAEPAEEVVAEEETATEEAVAEEETATEEAVAAEEEATEEAATEEVVVEEEEAATATPVVIVVTATPMEVAEETTTEETVEEEAVEETVTESGEPDLVVTLASLGIAAYGEETFNRDVIDGVSCADCHDVATGEYIDGPSLVNVEELAAEAGVSPERFVYEGIIDPEVHAGLSENYAEALSTAEIYDVVAYLLTIEAEGVEVEAAPEVETSSEPAAEGEEDAFTVAAAAGDAANGEELFNTMTDTGFMCATCHYVDQEAMLVGPGLLGIADRAATRIEGQSAAEYLHTSIVATNEYIVEGYPESVMPAFYTDVFSEDEINDIVAYLLTLHE